MESERTQPIHGGGDETTPEGPERRGEARGACLFLATAIDRATDNRVQLVVRAPGSLTVRRFLSDQGLDHVRVSQYPEGERPREGVEVFDAATALNSSGLLRRPILSLGLGIALGVAGGMVLYSLALAAAGAMLAG